MKRRRLREKAEEFAKKVRKGEISIEGGKKRLSKREMLRELEPAIRALREKRLAYTQIARILAKEFGVKVSESTLRDFCRKELGEGKRAEKIIPDPNPEGKLAV